jgi:dienelactone hydrolase
MRWVLALGAVIVLAGIVLAGNAHAQGPPGPIDGESGRWREQHHWIPFDYDGIRTLLYAQTCRPLSNAPARVVQIAHGTPVNIDEFPRMEPEPCDSWAVKWFLDRGYVVIQTMRRGYGKTAYTGYFEGYFSCEDPNFFSAGLETAKDLDATANYAAKLPYAKPSGEIVVGQSAGGWGTIAYDSRPHPLVTAMVNFAGGRGGHADGRRNNNCNPARLVQTAGWYGRTATTPMLWIYTELDDFFAPRISKPLYAEFTRGGGKADFILVPRSWGPWRHGFFSAPGGSRWWGLFVQQYISSMPQQ